MLWLVQRIFFGPESALAASKPPEELRLGQMAVLWPLAVLMLVDGRGADAVAAQIESGVHIPAGQGFWGGSVRLAAVTMQIVSNGEGPR